MTLITITDTDYDNIYAAVSRLVIDNAANIESLFNAIKQAFKSASSTVTDKFWYANDNDDSEHRSRIHGLTDIWTETNKNPEKTAEILFKAWYTWLTIAAFHAICATQIRKCIKEANLNEPWDLSLSGVRIYDKFYIQNILNPGRYYPGMALNVGPSGPACTFDTINVVPNAPDVFKESALADVLQGNIPVDLVIWRHRTKWYSIDQVSLNSIGTIIKEHFLVHEKATIQEMAQNK